MNSAAGAKIPSAETVEKLESLAAYAEKRIEKLKSEVVEMHKALEEHKVLASNAFSTRHSELLEENKKLKNEIEQWKKKVLVMENKLGNIETRVGDSLCQNVILMEKLNEQDEKFKQYKENINIQGEKLITQGKKLNEQEKKLNVQEKKVSEQEEKLNKCGEEFPSQTERKKEKKTKKEETASDEDASVNIGRLDIRIGKIISIKKHPDANSLYVEQIDVGEEKPRNVVSGLVKFIPMNELENRMVVVVCNMKPSKMRGILSEAMVLCANDSEKVEVLEPPEGVLPGEKVLVEGYSSKPDPVLNPKKKIFETVAADLKTDIDKRATYKGQPFYIPNKGIITSSTLVGASIK